MDHVYTKPHSPLLNGKLGRSHRSDEDEFYQLRTMGTRALVAIRPLTPDQGPQKLAH